MSMNCSGCEHDGFVMLNDKKVSYCKYFKETKQNMDRSIHPLYYPFQHGYCPQKTRKPFEDELILKSDVIKLIDRYYDKFIYESDADELIVEVDAMKGI